MGEPLNPARRRDAIFLALIFGSGFCGLMYEVVFTKLLTYVFGVTAYAVSTVLAAFMGGLALGSFLFGRVADRTRRPLVVYAVLELVIGLYCVLTPLVYPLLGELYGQLYQRYGWSPASVTLLRYGLCWGFILVPTILMGGTLPVAAKFFARAESEIGSKVSALYAINTLGAAVGTWVATYLLIDRLGLAGTIYLATALNILIAGVAVRLGKQSVAPSREEPQLSTATADRKHRLPAVPVVGAFMAGALALAYEVVWTHVLAQTIGNSVYAFGTMLFTFLLGIGLGSLVLARFQPTADRAAQWAGWSQWGVALATLVLLPVWDKVPLVFQLAQPDPPWRAVWVFLPTAALLIAQAWLPRAARAGPGRSRWILRVVLALAIVGLWLGRGQLRGRVENENAAFWVAESVRFLCTVNVLIWPTLFLGVTFPLLIRAHASGVADLGRRIGALYFCNTAGAIVGSVAAGFWLIPWLGSQLSLRVLAAGNWAVGVLLVCALAPVSARRKLQVVAVVTAAVGGLLTMVPRWDLRALSSGANVYFDSGRVIDEILYYAEDVQGGITSVVREGDMRVLLTNGKFEGNDGDEMAAQDNFAHVPMLYTRRHDRALVIGLGTGRTLAALASYPFAEIDAVELAPHIATAARQYFGHINAGVLDDPRVMLRLTDGRQWLQLTAREYDAITIEVSSIWFAGAANLYNREFYDQCAARLRPAGVLQQWVQLHHMRSQDLLVIFNTLRQVFPHVHLFLGSHQGVLIASRAPLETDYAALAAYQQVPAHQPWLRHVPLQNLFALLGTRLLDERALDNVLTNLVAASAVSTDLHPHLEYATPRGNFLPYDAWQRNVRWLRAYQQPTPPVIRNIPGPHEELIVAGCLAFGRGDVASARAAFQRAQQLHATPEVAALLRRLEEPTP